jgi:hypothetical protein
MYKQNIALKFLFLLVFGVFLNIHTTMAQDLLGSYSYTAKKDGVESTIKLYVYKEGSETYGRLRLEGNNTFGSVVEVNLWTMINGNYVDFYYEAVAGQNPFTSDAHLFTLSGTTDQATAVFSAKLKEKVPTLPPATVLKYDGKTPSFTIKEKAKSQTLEVRNQKTNK